MNLKTQVGIISTISQSDIYQPSGFSVVVNKLKIFNNSGSNRIINVYKYDISLGYRISIKSNYNLPAGNKLVIPSLTLEDGDILEADTDATSSVEYDMNYVEFTEMVTTGNESSETLYCEASEPLSGGNFVNIYYDSGTLKCRKTDISLGYKCDGFTRTAISTVPNNIEINIRGTNDQLTGLDIGETYYLSNINGSVSTTPPTISGNTRQQIGTSISTTEILYEKYIPIKIA